MNKAVFIFVIMSIILFSFSCSTSTGSDTTAPITTITFPANNQEFTQGAVVTITITATDESGIKEVKFYIDAAEVWIDNISPYEYVWDTGSAKNTTHLIFAKAWDTNENSSVSDTITVTITEGAIGTIIDIDGNVYSTITIGDQEWMMENLKVTHFTNGDSIPYIPSYNSWINTSSGAYCVYNNEQSNADIYGNLYNWYAVDSSYGLAPEGWHIPDYDDWQTLVDYLGGYSVAGGKMKEAGFEHWNNPNMGATNVSSFTALPGGSRYYYEVDYYGLGSSAYFWSSSELDSTDAWCKRLGIFDADISNFYDYKKCGFSVRCVRD